jgi:hypothetical protein
VATPRRHAPAGETASPAAVASIVDVTKATFVRRDHLVRETNVIELEARER